MPEVGTARVKGDLPLVGGEALSGEVSTRLDRWSEVRRRESPGLRGAGHAR